MLGECLYAVDVDTIEGEGLVLYSEISYTLCTQHEESMKIKVGEHNARKPIACPYSIAEADTEPYTIRREHA